MRRYQEAREDALEHGRDYLVQGAMSMRIEGTWRLSDGGAGAAVSCGAGSWLQIQATTRTVTAERVILVEHG